MKGSASFLFWTLLKFFLVVWLIYGAILLATELLRPYFVGSSAYLPGLIFITAIVAWAIAVVWLLWRIFDALRMIRLKLDWFAEQQKGVSMGGSR